MIQLEAIKTAVLISVLIIASCYDIKYRRIPNTLSLFCFLMGLIISIYGSGSKGVLQSLYSFLIAFSFMFIPYLMGNMGAGDVKLFSSLAVFYTMVNLFTILFIFCLIYLLLSLYTVIKKYVKEKRLNFNASYPMAPFIAGAFLGYILLF